MKKTILFLLLFAPSIALVAQVSIGFRGGLSFPKIIYETQDADLSFSAFRGLALAAMAEQSFSGLFAVQAELAFVQKGSIILIDYGTLGSVPDEAEIRINYLELPLLAKLKLGNSTVAAHVLAGPSFGYALSGYLKEEGEKETFSDSGWEIFKRFEFAGNIGGGIGLHLPSGKAFIDLRYQVSFANILNSGFDEIKIRNKSIIFNVGYLADLHKK
ncbi:MAG TPA: PorT family protein [Bacteroidetes bacterium]|nr:PorT family protein [Bacteroidota bacterium]